MRRANLISGFILLVLSALLLLWLIPWQVEEAYAGQVSPRLLPQICAAGIGLLSIVLIATNLRLPKRQAGSDPSPITWHETRAMLVIGGLLALGIWLFTATSPLIAAGVLVVGILFAMGERKILPYVLIPTGLLGGSYLLFYKFLGTAIL
ncbi:MAG: tripartite tricarboxylate transporter TctB family protein [Gammaproteobacteria bacterium]|nr:tripartite tricarboxylate transporter TctB family protein [Gammaproteobacteria bacterium]